MENTIYFDKVNQLTILGNWLQGRHREDIAILDAALFADYKHLYNAAVDGSKTLVQLIAEEETDGASITDIIAATDRTGIPTADYLEAKTTALVFQRNRLINLLSRPGADVPAITSQLLKVQEIIDGREVKPAAADLSTQYLKALEEETAAGSIRYGRGFENLTKRAGAMQRGQLIVLAARPATGKSAAALQIAYNAAEKGNKVLFFPLEMTIKETIERLILQQQIIESRTALKAANEEEKQTIKKFLDEVEAAGNFLIYEGENNLESIEQIIKEQRPDLVVIDQLTQVRTARRTKDIRERYTEITAELKHIAIEYKTAVLLLTQLNRAATDQSRPTLENLHESDSTGQNADVVLLMQRKDDESRPEFAKRTEITIHVVKNRGGEDGQRIAQVFDGSRFTFHNVSY